MKNKSFELSARSKELASTLDTTLCTDKQGGAENTEQSLQNLVKTLIRNRDSGGSVYLIGNGGSAAVTSHALTDFVNICRFRAFTLHESALITCMTNDFGYEHAYALLVNTMMRPGDILIAVSSSGKSQNICNAAKMAKQCNGTIVTFTGFNASNPLRQLGDLNFWVDSSDYGMVEIAHLIILHNIADRIGAGLKQEQASQAIPHAIA